MKKIIDTVLAEVLQTETRVSQESLLLNAARSVAPKAPTAPASDGVAKPKRIDPLISDIRKTGGTKLLITRGVISPLGIFRRFAGRGGAKLGFTAAKVAT
tara:strand:- start:40 stop:339 length:300 start_codon:yes stop_codon:yes gene_type:complete